MPGVVSVAGSMRAGETSQSSDVATRLRVLLSTRGLNVNAVSRETGRQFGESSPFFVPHNFCYNLAVQKITPHACQIFALSKLTGYSFPDLLDFFGYNPEQITRLQMKLHRKRTALLPAVFYNKSRYLPFLGTRVESTVLEQTRPLSGVVVRNSALTVGELEKLATTRFLYVRIGADDAMAAPFLAAGSVVRVDPTRTDVGREPCKGLRHRPIYLVEHAKGLLCADVRLIGPDRILLIPGSNRFDSLEFKLESEARILGCVDAEIRPMKYEPTGVDTISRITRNGKLGSSAVGETSFRELIRSSRERLALSFREAHELSRMVADEFQNEAYVISLGLLCDLEASETLPRHLEKVFTLCVIYCLNFWECLRLAGVPVQDAGKAPVPRQLMPLEPAERERPMESSTNATTLAEHLIRDCAEIPAFLYLGGSWLLPGLELSARNLYWVGRKERVLHSALEGALLLAVDGNAKSRKEESVRVRESMGRPLFLLLTRDGRYVCGCCSFSGNFITVVPEPDLATEPLRFEQNVEAEVIGQVTAVARLIS